MRITLPLGAAESGITSTLPESASWLCTPNVLNGSAGRSEMPPAGSATATGTLAVTGDFAGNGVDAVVGAVATVGADGDTVDGITADGVTIDGVMADEVTADGVTADGVGPQPERTTSATRVAQADKRVIM